MVAVIIAALIGFVVSTIFHILMLFQIYSPPREFIILINLGAGLLIYAAIMISKRVCAQNNIKDFRKVMLYICPEFSGLTGLLIMYTFAGFLYFLFKKYLGHSVLDNRADGGDIYGFSGHWMALYALAFTILYSCRKYLKMK